MILLLGCAGFARGQEVSRFEIFGGYSYAERLQLPLASTSSLNGWEAGVQYNVTSRLGLVMAIDGRDGTDYRNTLTSDGSTVFLRRPVNTLTFLFGPQVNVFRHGRVSVNLRVLAGFVHSDDTNANVAVLNINPGANVENVLITQTYLNNTFSMSAGGNADFRLKGGLSWRMLQPEMQLTRVDGRSQPNFRVTTGLVYSFGRR